MVVRGNSSKGFREDSLPASAHLFLTEAALKPFPAALERLEDSLRAGSEAALEGRKREADRAFALSVELVGLAHFGFNVIGDGFVKRGLKVGKVVVDRVCPPLWKSGVPSNFTNFSFTIR